MSRDEFSGFLASPVATVGSAVGLGNLWRFHTWWDKTGELPSF